LLKLRRGRVVAADPLEVEVAGERRSAWADDGLVGPCLVGDEVVVNVAALDLGLGSGGFDIVHANLTRGLDGGEAAAGTHVMKLNYTSLQHPIEPLERPAESPARPECRIPVLVLPLHGHLAPSCWAFARASGAALRPGFVQVPGGALPGSLSRDVAELRAQDLLAGVITVGPCFGGEHEAISSPGALHAAADALGWDAAVVGPGPGILGSATRYGHGGMAALEAAHAALALGLPTALSPRLSGADPRSRHRGVSHHTRAVLELLLGPVQVALPAVAGGGLWPDGEGEQALAELRGIGGGRHEVATCEVDLEAYARAGLPRRTMGRDLDEDRLFFAAPLAAGAALATLSAPG
jgi:hypothetical protein